MRIIRIALAACAMWCAAANAEGPIIGPLCIDGVASTPRPELTAPREDGVWTTTDYRLDPTQANNARLIVFDRAITHSEKLESCQEVEKRMLASGAQTIVSGKIRELKKLRADLFTSPSGNRIEIKHGNFAVTLGRVDSGSRPVVGGKIDFRGAGAAPGSLLWINATDDVVSSAAGITGEFEIESWNRKIVGAQVTLGDGLTYLTTLVPKNESNVTVRVDLNTGNTRLWAGNLNGQPAKAAPGDMRVPSLSLKSADLQASSVGIVVNNGISDITLSGLKGSSTEAVIPGPNLQWKAISPSLTIDRVEGIASQESSGLKLTHVAFQGLSMRKAATVLESSSGSDLFRGVADTTFSQLSEASRTAKSSWTMVSSTALSHILPAGMTGMEWNESGPTSSLQVDGQFDINRLSLGGIDVGQQLTLKILPSALDGKVVIPVKANIPAASGTISFANGDQTVAIQGRLERFGIDGQLVVPLPNVQSSRLEVSREKLNLSVGAAVSVSPFIAGAKPNFLDGKLELLNDTDISIAKEASSGTALLTANELLIAQPVLKVGENGTRNPATVDLKSEGMAKLRYDLTSGKSTVVQAKLSASDVTFSLLGSQPRVLDIGGDQITDPSGSLKRISVEIDQLSAIKVESAQLDALSFNASHIAKVTPAGAAAGVSYSGDLDGPLVLDMARAARVTVGDAIELAGFEVNGLKLTIRNASVDFGGGINVAHGSLTLKVDQTREVTLSDRHLQEFKGAELSVGGKIVVHSPSMSINDAVATKISLNLDGLEDALNGKGTLDFGAFTGSARNKLAIKFDCRDTGELDVDMETNMAVVGGSFEARMQNGKLTADGATGPILANAHSTHATGCDNPITKHVVQVQGKWWTDGICSKGFEVYHCRWESPELSYAYHVHLGVVLISATVLMSNPHVYLNSLGEVSVCNLGALVVTALPLAGGYSPGIDSPYPGLDNIVNGIIQIGFVPAQSLVATSLGVGIGWLASSIATGAGNLLCIGKPL